MALIYMATSKTSGKSYIGQTIGSISNRKKTHKHRALNGQDNIKFYNAVRKYGFDDFEWKVLYDNISQDQLDIAEICAIYIHDTYYEGYNSTLGGDFNPNLKGKNNPMYGKKRPDLSKYNREHKKNSTLSSEHKEKIKKSLIGNKRNLGNSLTEEHKNKISLKMKEQVKNRLKDNNGRFIRSK